MLTPGVAGHYTSPDLASRILATLAANGSDLDNLKPEDLASIDFFHVGGREATSDLADLAEIHRDMKILDVGCGIGGSARFLALEKGCHVTGIDLTPEYIEAALKLTVASGLGDAVDYHTGNALEMPFESDTFDMVWTEHTQMNIARKLGFYHEIKRVLVPGGRLAFHDIFLGPEGDPRYPLPWSEDGTISFLTSAADAKTLLLEMGFRIIVWEDRSRHALDWFSAARKGEKPTQEPGLSPRLLMGETAGAKIGNVAGNLEQGRITVCRGVLECAEPGLLA